jgi:cytochrome c oxidase assembly protein subunit 15
MFAVAHNAMGAGLLLSMVHLLWRHHLLAQPAAAPAFQTTTINREVTV